jgi:hypothetical protein
LPITKIVVGKEKRFNIINIYLKNMTEQKIFNYLSKLSAEFTAAVTNIITSNGHGLVEGDLLQFTTSDTLPAGLDLATNYYVRDVTTNTFKVSAIPGGLEVDITDTGTGTHTFWLKGKVIMSEGFEHISLNVNTANSANLTMKFQGSDSEDAPDFNAAQSATNKWDYINVVDLQSSSTITGDTGLSPAGVDDNRKFELNVNGMRWITAVITSFTAGTADVTVKLNKQY